MASTQYLTRKNLQCLRYDNVVAITAETLDVMSQEYRDIFAQAGDSFAAYGTYTSPEPGADPVAYRTYRTQEAFASQSGVVMLPGALQIKTQGYTSPPVSGSVVVDNAIVVATETVTAAVSDDLAHHDLRQTELQVTHWKIDRGADIVPRYIYATWADGDAWADYPVNQFVSPDA